MAPKTEPKRQNKAPIFWISFFHTGFSRRQLT
jgi:hypothetical protein